MYYILGTSNTKKPPKIEAHQPIAQHESNELQTINASLERKKTN